ncbi:MAG: amino acid ABC transporter substrate-binding protein, partial [Spirochaetales bacterium]|nr:amino acid ABC transporter substrate-binding protein [Spirochaetales bacterium]
MTIKKLLLLTLAVLVVLGSLAGCTPKPQKEEIVIGASRPVTGPLSIYEQMAFGPIYKLWVEEVNAEGGIYVKEYDKKLPVRMIVYDDESDIQKMTENLEKLVLEDKVDLLLPSAGTDMLFAAAPIANDLGYVLMGAEGGASKLEEVVAKLPYVFSVLSYSTHNQVPALAEMLAANNIRKAAIVALSDLHGDEYYAASQKAFAANNIEIVMKVSIPVGTKDLMPIITDAKEANVDAFLLYAYPDENFAAIGQSMALGFNPKVFLVGPGGNFEFIKGIFGPAVEGIMCWGAWNEKVSPEHKAFAQKLVAKYGADIIDWWGHDLYYASLQFLKAAIEDTGTLNQEKLKDAITSNSYTTILGKTWFDEKHLLAMETHSGEVGQWQNGIYEVVAPADKITAKPIIPKP